MPATSSDEAAFDSQSSSVIKLNNSTVLYLREVNKFLSLVCILREDNFSRQGVIDYNVLCFREAISQVFELRSQALSKIMETSIEALGGADDVDDDAGDEDELDFGKADTTAAVVGGTPATGTVLAMEGAARSEYNGSGRTKQIAATELNDSASVLA